MTVDTLMFSPLEVGVQRGVGPSQVLKPRNPLAPRHDLLLAHTNAYDNR